MAPDGRILLQKRPAHTMHGGLWEFPGGKVDPGESAEQAAVREMEEELGVVLKPEDLVPVGFASGALGADTEEGSSQERSPMRGIVILLYLCRSWQGVPAPREGGEAGWFESQAIADLAMPPLDYPLASALKVRLSADFEKSHELGVDRVRFPF
ncbi:(deoxy)nucleoside triphosphate pyrophosphohydrolase [Novosphingobium sp. 1949]|uniref:8-oxo-dGTP diphosphatase n=1 Tax=Novosphingobium organovorum TaxID=2930092 RepID=A0ABT0BDC3_9SPHN|nr:(deoxy)nucleoside triphosphate pyrophosphohydrolase [Novosphingobium organovorum]